MKKRFLTLILVLALLLSCLPFAAAQEAPQEEPAVDAVPVEEVTVPAEADLAPVGDADIPVITSAAVAADGVKLTYTPYEGAARYFLFIQKPDGAGWKKIGSATETTFIHKNPVNNTTYIYTVRAADETGAFISGYDKVGLSFTYFSAPVLKKIESVYGGQRISWNANDGAAFYRVYIKANGAWTALADTAATSYTNKNVVSGTSYTYTVRCLSGEKKLLSYFDKKGLKGVYVAAPTITSFTPVSGGTKIGWKKEDGAVMYRLFYQGASGWKKIADTSGTEYIHSSLTAGTVYKYTVRALDNNGSFISGYNTAGWSFKYIAPIEITSVKKVDAGTQLGWTAEPTAAGYRIYRKPFGGSWTSIGTSNTAKFTDTGAKANTLYAYTLRTLDANGKLTSYFLSNTPYCYNGAIANGKITVNGSSITFKNGYPCKGYVTMGGKMYYYNADGVIQKNGLVGSKSEGYRYADQNGVIQLNYTGIATNANGTWYLYDGLLDFTYRNGVTVNGVKWNVLNGRAYKVTTEEDKTMYLALRLVDKVCDKSMTKAQKMRKMFGYFKTAYSEYRPRTPNSHENGWQILYANDILVGGGGNCMSYGAAFAFVAKAIGYNHCYACNSGGHGWAEADGLVYDPEWDMHYGNYTYYAVSYDYGGDVNYRAGISAGYSWMRVEIYKGR